MSTLNRKVEPRRFRLKRIEDESGVSGTGYVAEGIKFSDGQTVINWLTDTRSIGIYHSVVEMIYIHGHGGKTVIEWVDEESADGSGGDLEPAPEKSKDAEMPAKALRVKAAKTVLKNNNSKTRSATRDS